MTPDIQEHILERLDYLADQVAEVRAEIAGIKGAARAWGAVPGIAAVAIALVALLMK